MVWLACRVVEGWEEGRGVGACLLFADGCWRTVDAVQQQRQGGGSGWAFCVSCCGLVGAGAGLEKAMAGIAYDFFDRLAVRMVFFLWVLVDAPWRASRSAPLPFGLLLLLSGQNQVNVASWPG